MPPLSLGENVKEPSSNATAILDTSMGEIRAELWSDQAPTTVENFLNYVDAKHYDGLVFHRVIPGFMIQGGGMTADLKARRAGKPIKNEARADCPNERGTLAMARTSDINSATSQFFINVADNDFLNHRNETADGFGYCAFGKVTAGMDVVDAIAKVNTGTQGSYEDVPVKPVEIRSIRRG
jgi:cyclophilin family peptidyl-prolyl cis-trans isomerase